MHGGSAQRTQHLGFRPGRTGAATTRRRPASRRSGPTNYNTTVGSREARKTRKTNVYRRRRLVAIFVVVLSVAALVLAVLVQSSEARDQALPIDPNNAGPDAVLGEAAGIGISTPIRPEDVTGLGYHPEGESLVEISPRGKNLSANAVTGLFAGSSTAEKIQYYVMDSASRQGPNTGALDIGAEAGTKVYAPVTGVVTAIRPDPVLQKDASVVEIKPADDPNMRVSVSLVQGLSDGLGPKSPVTAGTTELGSVADSAQVLNPQLASYTSDTGNHVTVSVSRAN